MAAGVFALGASVAITILASLALLVRRPEGAGSDARNRRLARGALTVLALVLRVLLPWHASVHENRHGWFLITQYGHLFSFEEHGVPSALLVLVDFARRVLPSGEEPVFVVNLVLSAATVPALGAWVTARSGDAFAGLLSGALLTLAPFAILLGPSDEYLVSAGCFTLLASHWLPAGAVRGDPLRLAAGVGCAVLGACAREVTMPLVLIPFATLVTAPVPRAFRGRAVGAVLAVVLLCTPVGLCALASAAASGDPKEYLGLPALPFSLGDRIARNPSWAGWQSPFVPPWFGVAILASLLFVAVRAVHGTPARAARLALLSFAVAFFAGGFVSSGNFPSNLRHQAFALTLSTGLVGWSVAWLIRAAWSTPRGRVAASLVPVTAMGLWLVLHPESVRPRIGMMAEWRFFHAVLADRVLVPPGARVVVMADQPAQLVPYLPVQWVTHVRPDVVAVRANEPGAVSGSAPVRFLLDRHCFTPRRPCDPLAPYDPPVRTPLGLLHDDCAAFVSQHPWRVLARESVDASRRLPGIPTALDLPGYEPVSGIALLGL